jgi:hypothetical protein
LRSIAGIVITGKQIFSCGTPPKKSFAGALMLGLLLMLQLLGASSSLHQAIHSGIKKIFLKFLLTT